MVAAGAEPPLPIHHDWRLLRACREGQTEGAEQEGMKVGRREGRNCVRRELDWSSSDHGEDALCTVTLQMK